MCKFFVPASDLSVTFLEAVVTFQFPHQGGQQTQAEASKWLTYLQLCTALPSLIIAAILGSVSDKVGRKVAIVTPVVGALAT